jgi:hypothetical protein
MPERLEKYRPKDINQIARSLVEPQAGENVDIVALLDASVSKKAA